MGSPKFRAIAVFYDGIQIEQYDDEIDSDDELIRFLPEDELSSMSRLPWEKVRERCPGLVRILF